jgi:hypothetical protein
MEKYKKNSLSLVGAISMGTNVMIGAGIFALLEVNIKIKNYNQMRNLKLLTLLLFIGALNFSMISCRETEDEGDNMEMHSDIEDEEMKDDDMQMDHNQEMNHEDDHF